MTAEKKPSTAPVVSYMRHPIFRALSLAGLVALLLLGAWGIIYIARILPSAIEGVGEAISSPFSRLFSSNSNDEEVHGESAGIVPTSTTRFPPQYNFLYSQTPQQNTAAEPSYPQTAKIQTNYASRADLAVQITEVTATQVRFTIYNRGGTTAPAGWIVIAELPLSPSFVYYSPAGSSIPPGGYILNTLDWSSYISSSAVTACPPATSQYPHPYQYSTLGPTFYNKYVFPCEVAGYRSTGGTPRITIDPYRMVPDADRANNTVGGVR